MMRPLIDAHCHPAPGEPAPPSVGGRVVCGVRPRDTLPWRGVPEVAVCVGLHPWVAQEGVDVPALRELIERGGVSAIGEIGLDRSRRADHVPTPLQEAALTAQLDLAAELGLPAVLHVVRAHGRCLELLADLVPPLSGGVVHGFTGSADVARRYLDLGLHISLGGGRAIPEAAARAVPRDRLLVETDDGVPGGLPAVVQAVAELRGETFDEVACYTAANAVALFPALQDPGGPADGAEE